MWNRTIQLGLRALHEHRVLHLLGGGGVGGGGRPSRLLHSHYAIVVHESFRLGRCCVFA